VKIKILLSILLVSQAFYLTGQFYFSEITKINIDSLEQILPELMGTDKIEVLNKLSFSLCSKNPDSAIKLINDVLALSKSMNYKKGIADGFLNLGYYYYYQDSLKSTITNFLRAVRIYEEINPTKEYAFLLTQIGFINLMAGRFKKTMDYTKRSWSIFHRLGNRINEADGIHFFAMSHLRNQNFDSALYYYNKELHLRDTISDLFRTASLFHEVGITYWNKYFDHYKNSDLTKAFSLFHKGKKIMVDNNIKYFPASFSYWIGRLHITLGSEKDLKEGYKYLIESKKIVESSNPTMKTTPANTER